VTKPFDPFALWRLSVEVTQMTAEANTVIAMRMMGMAGLVPMHKDETARMISEKQDALAASGRAMSRAMMAGKGPTEVMAAGVRPMRTKTRANAKRLTKPGRKT
jgi:hypothetical protein